MFSFPIKFWNCIPLTTLFWVTWLSLSPSSTQRWWQSVIFPNGVELLGLSGRDSSIEENIIANERKLFSKDFLVDLQFAIKIWLSALLKALYDTIVLEFSIAMCSHFCVSLKFKKCFFSNLIVFKRVVWILSRKWRKFTIWG